MENEFYCQYCNKRCKNKNSLRQHEVRCPNNTDRDTKLTETFNTYRHTYGAWNKGLNRKIDKRIDDYANKSISKLAKFNKGRPLTTEHRQHISQSMLNADLGNIKRHSYGKGGYYDDIWFASTYELAYYIFCKDHHIDIIRNKQRFKYEYNGEIHNYTPDFYSNDENVYIEIKGYETEKDRAKYKSIDNLKVLYYDDISYMIKYVQEKFNLTDISKLYIGV